MSSFNRRTAKRAVPLPAVCTLMKIQVTSNVAGNNRLDAERVVTSSQIKRKHISCHRITGDESPVDIKLSPGYPNSHRPESNQT